MPALTWNKAKGATSYEVQISSDSGFNPALVTVTTAEPPLRQQQDAAERRVLLARALAGRQERVVEVVEVRKFTKKWNATAVILTPAALTAIAYPNPTILSWAPVPGAVTYKVAVASGASGGGVDAPGGIISTGALAWSDGGKPIETSNTNLAVSTALHPGTYYWQVIPVDAQGYTGTPSAIFSFAWIWAGTTTPTVDGHGARHRDLRPAVLVAGDPGRGELRGRGQPDVGLRAGLAPAALADDRDVLRADEVAAEQHVLLARPRRRSAGSGRARGTTGPRSRRPTTRPSCPGPPNLHGLRHAARR